MRQGLLTLGGHWLLPLAGVLLTVIALVWAILAYRGVAVSLEMAVILLCVGALLRAVSLKGSS